MPSSVRAQVVAVGSFLPERRLTNIELERMVDTNNEWIVSRTGIRERRIAVPGTPVSDLALPAAKECLAKAGVAADSLDGIIMGTITPDHVIPASGNILQHKLGATKAWAYDILNACNGFVAALTTACSFIESGRARRILVVGADVMSSVVDYKDRETCILFGDGAGAVLVEAGPAEGRGIVGFKMASDGGHGDLLAIPASGSRNPVSQRVLEGRLHFMKQDGKKVFQHAVRRMSEVGAELMAELGLTNDDIDLLVPHQANARIIIPTAERLGLPLEKVVINLDRCANTTGATIPLALADAERDGRLKPGSRVLLVAFGGGFAWGACYLTWGRG